jgi:hypothetical protein
MQKERHSMLCRKTCGFFSSFPVTTGKRSTGRNAAIGFWVKISRATGLAGYDSVRNPYLGTNHPQYKATMLNCGGPKDTINFMVVK